MPLSDVEFNFIAKELKDRSGLSIGKEKEYLLESRLQPMARELGFDSVSMLISSLVGSYDTALLDRITDAMTTNESMFFRDTKPFEQFKSIVLPALTAACAGRPIRIWSAACSSGQEAYSLVMTLEEERSKYPGLQYEIIGTDISPTILKKAENGIYSQFEIQRGLPIQMLLKYFDQLEKNQWQAKPVLRDKVKFQHLNLLQPFSQLGRMDVIMCRNVLIYFDDHTKSGVLDRMASLVQNPGFLFLGSAETIMGLCDRFQSHSPEARGVFIPK